MRLENSANRIIDIVRIEILFAMPKNCKTYQAKKISIVKNIDQHLVSVTLKPVNIKWDKPTIVGATMLDLAKFYML